TKGGVNFFRTDIEIPSSIFRNDLFILDSAKVNSDLMSERDYVFELNETDVLELYFNQIAYSARANVTYEYRLDPMDKDWIALGSGYLRFSNLSAGSYELKIRSVCENDIGEPIAFNIVVALPWWKMWWALTFYIIFALGLIALVFKLLLNR